MADGPVSPRFVYLGTSAFAATVLGAIAAAGHRPALVVTPPDRRRGRGRRLQPPPVAALAREIELPLHQTADVNAAGSLAAVRETQPAVGAVCAFGQLIRRPLLDELELLNVHPSLLPRWRGAAPIERAIMAGDPETGVAVMRLVEALDAGPVALVERVPIEPREDFGSLEPRLAKLGGELLARALALLAAGRLELRPQAEEGITYAEKIAAEERRLDTRRPAGELERVVRALTPHIGAYLELAGGDRLGVARAREAAGEGLEPGEMAIREGTLVVGAGAGTGLQLERVRPAGKRAMDADEFLRGHTLPRLAPAAP